jgi:hypothetical protein
MIYKASIFDNGDFIYEPSTAKITSSIEYIIMLNGYAIINNKTDDWSQGHKTVYYTNVYYIDTEFNFEEDDFKIVEVLNRIKELERDKKISTLLK